VNLPIDNIETDSQFRRELVDLFATMPINHGEIFDDGRRWCCVCESPRLMCAAVDGNMWADKTCSECTSLWPEYIEMVVNGLLTDDDIADEIPFERVH